MRHVVLVVVAVLMAVGGVCSLEPLASPATAHAHEDHHPVASSSSAGDVASWAQCDPPVAASTGPSAPGNASTVAVRPNVPGGLMLAETPPPPFRGRLAAARPPAFLLHAAFLI